MAGIYCPRFSVRSPVDDQAADRNTRRKPNVQSPTGKGDRTSASRERPEYPTIEDSRAGFEKMMRIVGGDTPANVRQVDAGGVPSELVSAEGASEDSAVLYFHGGGYAIGSPRTHREFARRLSAASRAQVLVIDYRLAPESPFPAPVEDAVSAYRWLLSEGYAPDKLAIAGDSAGGGLTAAALVSIRYQGLPLPACGVCLSPWVDMEGLGDSMTGRADRDPMVQKDGLVAMAGVYLDGADPRAPLAAPMYADLGGLPRCSYRSAPARRCSTTPFASTKRRAPPESNPPLRNGTT